MLVDVITGNLSSKLVHNLIVLICNNFKAIHKSYLVALV